MAESMNFCTAALRRAAAVSPVLGWGACVALALTGCVDSAAPILTDSTPAFGPRVRLHVYTLTEGIASGPEIGTFRWDGAKYHVVGRPTLEVADFTVHAFAGNDLIVQSRSSKPKTDRIEYALVRKQIDGVYLVIAIDEDDADDATRAKFCTRSTSSSCRIATREALLAFAQVTAAKPNPKGALAITVDARGR
jgi:hypothetical protein